jgi:hypothetical protein
MAAAGQLAARLEGTLQCRMDGGFTLGGRSATQDSTAFKSDGDGAYAPYRMSCA